MQRIVFVAFLFLMSVQLTSCQKDVIEIKAEPLVSSKEEGVEYLAIFGDIQFYTTSTYNHHFRHSLSWIEYQIENGVNIKSVLHTGDVCHNPNADSHWNCFDRAMADFSKVVPFYSMIGDHDYTWYDDIHIDGRNNTQFNEHLQFPLSMKNVIEQFESGRMENVVVKNEIQGQRIDLLILEFGPRKEVVDWANAYVKAHPNHMFVLMTHEYLEKGGGRRVKGLKMAARLQNTTYTTPDQLWERLIRCNDNILCVLCGHVEDLYDFTIDINDFGREVPQIQHNIQSPDFRYDNWLMLWEFPADSDSANVFIYNTQTNKYYDDTTSLFRFKYRK